MKDRASTFFLKAVLVLIGAAALALCVFLLPQIWYMVLREMPEYPHLIYPALIGFSLTAIPFFLALLQAFKLLQYVDANTAFSEASVEALKNITFCAIAISVCFAACQPLLFMIAHLDDAPGLGAMGLTSVCAPLVVATFAAVLQKLIRSGIDLQTENDLTV